MPSSRDPRWILLTETGEYTILGRHREPDGEQIKTVEAELARVGVSGWIAIMSNSEYVVRRPELVMVKPLREPRASFEAAVQAFNQCRAKRSAAIERKVYSIG